MRMRRFWFGATRTKHRMDCSDMGTALDSAGVIYCTTEPRLTEGAGRFFAREYVRALKDHYPELFRDGGYRNLDAQLHIGFLNKWFHNHDVVGVDAPARFRTITQRPWASERSAWAVSGGGANLRHVGAYGCYKGLINCKSAIDLVLYSNLIWELQPQTILEFGSLQGGSGLWFADHLEILCGHGTIHSFEMCHKCISPRASHPRLSFHETDLRDLGTLDVALLQKLPHPWLVVDDAHVNLDNLVPLIMELMVPGDYYVIEDAFTWRPVCQMVRKVISEIERLGFLVDTKFTDAFGQNVTVAPNGWLVKA
jgi:cephalosporin hydroxylase